MGIGGADQLFGKPRLCWCHGLSKLYGTKRQAIVRPG